MRRQTEVQSERELRLLRQTNRCSCSGSRGENRRAGDHSIGVRREDAFVDARMQAEIVCVTEELACAQLAVLEELRGWQLISAVLEPLTYSAS